MACAPDFLRYIRHMKARIVELYKDGQRLAREVALAAEPVAGELIVFDSHREDGNRRSYRMADLLQITPGVKRPLLHPLFEPTIVRMSEGDGGFVLRGYQLTSKKVGDDHVVTEFVQEWWVRM